VRIIVTANFLPSYGEQETRCRVRILWRGKFSANTHYSRRSGGFGELSPLSEPMRVSDDSSFLFVLQDTQ
jgi:hypothetical protein